MKENLPAVGVDLAVRVSLHAKPRNYLISQYDVKGHTLLLVSVLSVAVQVYTGMFTNGMLIIFPQRTCQPHGYATILMTRIS